MFSTIAILLAIVSIVVLAWWCGQLDPAWVIGGVAVLLVAGLCAWLDRQSDGAKSGGFCSNTKLESIRQSYIDAMSREKTNHGASPVENRNRDLLNCAVSKGEFIEISDAGTRPLSWLAGEDGIPLDFDGYNDTAKIAFEHNGWFHYKPQAGQTRKYLRGCMNDDRKRRLAAEHGISMIILHPYVPENQHFNYILSRLKDLNVLAQQYQSGKLGSSWTYIAEIAEPRRAHDGDIRNGVIVDRRKGWFDFVDPASGAHYVPEYLKERPAKA